MPNDYDLGRMQEEAIRRAREMQSRAKIPRQNTGNRRPAQHTPEPEEPPEQPREQQTPIVRETPQTPVEVPTGTLLDSLFRDKERTIILALLILLSGDGGHNELMFALMFLLM